jgi:hypothetical protein
VPKLPEVTKPFVVSFAGVRVRLETTCCSKGIAGGQDRAPPATLQAGMPELRSTHIIF